MGILLGALIPIGGGSMDGIFENDKAPFVVVIFDWQQAVWITEKSFK